MAGFLSGLGAFAGGLAEGYDRGSRTRQLQDENKRQQEEHNAKMHEVAQNEALIADLQAAGSGPRTDLPHLPGTSFTSAQEAAAAAAAATPPPAQAALPAVPKGAPDQAASQAAGLPSGGDPLAPLPDTQAQAAPPPQAQAPAPGNPQAPQVVQYRDPMTNRWYNLPQSDVRPPNDTDKVRDMAAVYMRHGKPEMAEQLLANHFQRMAGELKYNQENAASELSRTLANPTAFAQSATHILGDTFGTGIEVGTQMVNAGGKQVPVLTINQKGSATPPMYLDANGQPSTTPVPGSYPYQAAALISQVKGDGGIQLLAQMTSIQAQVQNMAIADKREGREEAAFPLEQSQRRASIANTQAQTGYTGVLTSNARDQGTYNAGEYADSVSPEARQEGVTMRNRNPGALKWSPWQAQYGGKPDPNSEFTIFPDAQSGIKAQEALLAHSYAGKSVNQLVDTYSPPGPENSPASVRNYKMYIARQAGLKNLNDPIPANKMPAVAQAMREFETGRRASALPPKEARAVAIEGAKNARERLEAIRSQATTLAAQSVDPSDPAFESTVRSTMLQLVSNEPPEVKNAFNQAYGAKTLMRR